MKYLDQIREALHEKKHTSYDFNDRTHDLHMNSDFLLALKCEVEALMPLMSDPGLDRRKTEVMGFNVVLDDSLNSFEFRVRVKS
jgi:hypothetical protein